jgi:hypothetical protein
VSGPTLIWTVLQAWDRPAGDSGAGQDPRGQNLGDGAVEPQGDALPGQRQPGADHVVAEADVAGRVHGPVDLGHVPGRGGPRSGARVQAPAGDLTTKRPEVQVLPGPPS